MYLKFIQEINLKNIFIIDVFQIAEGTCFRIYIY